MTLPIIDLENTAPDAVALSLATHGFLYLTGHGIDAALVDRSFAVMKAFFAQSSQFKNGYVYTDAAANFGFQGVATERLDPGNLPDLKEAFTMRNALARADDSTRWPAGEFRDVALSLYTAALGAAYKLLELTAMSLGVPSNFFTERHRGENVTLRFLHYPAGLPAQSVSQLGAGAHTDYGSITLLFQDHVGGLELLGLDGVWRAAPPMTGAIIINAGDLLERWTNGRFRSTMHRVRPSSSRRERYSMALFVDPEDDVEIECFPACVDAARPLLYPRITAGEHIRQKIAATHSRSATEAAQPVNED